ncbi:TolB family protein [Streptomyces sp. NPDC092296]|uniref:TolB family protein n=1 Tax=Streptomyces sp. NPDC092296 TaxID=3366012 RepID=UPI0037FFA0BD
MISRTRRTLAALTSAGSLAAGLIGATAPDALAATGPADGRIALYGGSGVQLVNADGSGLRSVPGVPNYGYTPSWSSDGSRLVAGWSQLVTARAEGRTAAITLPWATGVRSGTSYEDPVFWWNSRYIVFSTGGQLAYGPSDGTGAPQPLLTEKQEPETVCDVHPAASFTGTLAFERRSGYGCYDNAGIWTYDSVTRKLKKIIAVGSAPVYSEDGTKLAFTRVVGDWTQLFTANADGSGIRQLTSDDGDHLNPSWAPSGGRIAYDAHSGHAGWSDDVPATKILDLATGTATTLTGKGSRPAWQPLRKNAVFRVYGTGGTRIDTAASRWTYDKTGGKHVDGLITAKSAVLVDKGIAAYAAPAIALGAEKRGPVLTTSAGSLDAAAAKELKRVLPKGRTVYLVGNRKALSDKVLKRVRALGYKPVRLDGADRYALSVRVARQIAKAPEWIFVADGSEYRDPFAAASAAGALGYQGKGVVLLTDGKKIPASMRNYLNGLNPKRTRMVTVGSKATTAMTRVSLKKVWTFWTVGGKTHESVAANLARFWWVSPVSATVLHYGNWRDAVAGASATVGYGPLLWSASGSLSAATGGYLSQEAASVGSVQTYGGGSSYGAGTLRAIGASIAASADWAPVVKIPNGALSALDNLRSFTTPTAPPTPTTPSRPTADPSVVPGEYLPAPAGRTTG